jgi:hypothetical protein
MAWRVARKKVVAARGSDAGHLDQPYMRGSIMRTLSASASYGNHGQYVARITGRDNKYTFEREFLGRKTGKRGEDTSADVDEPGLYETCSVGKRGKESTYWVLLDCPQLGIGTKGDTMRLLEMDKSDAMKVAKALDAGRSIAQIVEIYRDTTGEKPVNVYRLLSERAAAKQQAAATVESAIEACWAALQSLPTKEAKKVMTALRLRISPPAAKEDPEAARAAEAEAAQEAPLQTDDQTEAKAAEGGAV